MPMCSQVDRVMSFVAVEKHAVALLADFAMPTHPDFFGAIIDNDPRVGVRLLQPSDRTVDGSRQVCDVRVSRSVSKGHV